MFVGEFGTNRKKRARVCVRGWGNTPPPPKKKKKMPKNYTYTCTYNICPNGFYCSSEVGASKAVLLLWIFYVFVLPCVCYVFVCVCLYVLCGHLLGKG